MNNCAIFINADNSNNGDSNYNDSIVTEFYTGNMIIKYSGQTNGVYDYYLKKTIESQGTFYVFSKQKKNGYWIYHGKTTISHISKARTKNINEPATEAELLQIELTIKKINVENIGVPSIIQSHYCRLKKDCCYHIGLIDENENEIISHDRNYTRGILHFTT